MASQEPMPEGRFDHELRVKLLEKLEKLYKVVKLQHLQHVQRVKDTLVASVKKTMDDVAKSF